MVSKKLLLLMFILPSFLLGQLDINQHMIGPSVGFSFLGSTLQFGLSHEYSISLNQLGWAESGILGVGGIFRYWEYSESFRDFEWNYTDILLGVQTNYHFYMANDNIDPWIGFVAAYDFGGAEIKYTNSNLDISDKDYAGFFIGLNAGLRYWITKNMAISTRLGIGTLSYAALELGFDYELN